MTLESSKNLCGVGSLLLLLTPLPVGFIGGSLGLVGIILLLIGLKGMSDHYREQGIFNNALYGFILMVVGVVVVAAVVVVTMFAMMSSIGINLSDVSSWSSIGPAMMGYFGNPSNLGNMWGFIGAIIAALVVLFVFVIVASMFIRKSLNSLAKKTGVHFFETAGILLLIGAVLTIIAVGLVLIWVAFLLVTIAFFQVKVK